MSGWIVPPPKEPAKSSEEFDKERKEKGRELIKLGYLSSSRIKEAMLRVRREDFIPHRYRDYAYREVPLPLPGENATISCPHSYPLFYELLGLAEGHRFLEVGLGSSYGSALAREVVGSCGLVVSVEIDRITFAFARDNLKEAGYRDIVLIQGDGRLLYPKVSPYDWICITAVCKEMSSSLMQQLTLDRNLIAPVIEHGSRYLAVFEKEEQTFSRKVLCQVLYL